MANESTATDCAPAMRAVWRLRMAGKVDESRAAFDLIFGGSVARRAGLVSPEARFAQLVSGGTSPHAAVDALVFEASLERYALRLDAADALLNAAESLAQGIPSDDDSPDHPSDGGLLFQLHFQRALNFFVRQKFSAALDEFISAAHVTSDSFEKHYARFNQIICLENLGYGYGTLMRAFETSFVEVSTDPRMQDVTLELSLLRIREAFRHARVDFITARLEELLLASPREAYLLGFIAALPTFAFPTSAVDRAIDVLVAHAQSFSAPYRTRTLSGLVVSDDIPSQQSSQRQGPQNRIGGARRNDEVDRFYLWVWRWLARPNARAVDSLLRLRDNIVSRAGEGQLCASDALQLTCALRWLALFGGESDQVAQRVAGAQDAPQPAEFPLLETESAFLDALFAARDGDGHALSQAVSRVRQASAAVPCSALFLLPQLVEASLAEMHPPGTNNAPPSLAVLCESLKALVTLARTQTTKVAPLPHEKGSSEVFARVDVLAKKIRVRDETIHSDALAGLLLAFQKRDTVPVGDLLARVFGFTRKTACAHDAKLANLLARANGVFKGGLRFNRRGENVHMTRLGPSLETQARLEFIGDSEHALLLSGGDGRTLVSGFVRECAEDPGRMTSRPAPVWSALKTRAEIEILLGVSRSSAVRLLRRLVAENHIVRLGEGKAARYRVSDTLNEAVMTRITGRAKMHVPRIATGREIS